MTALGPRDSMRAGLGTVKGDLSAVHPLEPVQKEVRRRRRRPAARLPDCAP